MSSFLAGARDDHLLGAALEVQRRLVAVGEAAGGLEHDVDAELLPGQLGRDPSPRARASRRRRRRCRPSPRPRRPGKRPCTESYLSRWASVSVSVMSLTATKSMSLTPIACAARTTLRPMRPKPLMPTRIAIVSPSLDAYASVTGGSAPREGHRLDPRRPAPPERRRRLGQRGAGGEDVVHQHARRARAPRAPRRRPPRWPGGPRA